VEARVDHPEREEFMRMLTSESDKASTAVKDLMLVRALAVGQPVEDLQRVTVSELFLAIREDLSEDLRHGFTPPPPGLPDLYIDKALLSDLIARCYETASETNPAEEHVVKATTDGDFIEVSIDLGPPTEELDVMEGIRNGRRGLRAAAIAYRLLPRWNGSLESKVSDSMVRIAFKLPSA
jgi:hypothetical protein